MDSIDIMLYISDAGYQNCISPDDRFYRGATDDYFAFGEIACEIFNIPPAQYNNLANRYEEQHATPTDSFIESAYDDLRNIGLSDLTTRAFLLYMIKCFNDKEQSVWDSLINAFYVFNLFSDPYTYSQRSRYKYGAKFSVTLFEDERGSLLMRYSDIDIMALMELDIFHIRKNNIRIQKCAYCHKRFVPINGNNKKFCADCRHTHIDKAPTDEFRRIYRIKYKTMRQRAQRSKDSFEYEKLYTKPWENAVQEKLKEYRSSNDLDGFKKYLEQSMSQYKPKEGAPK